MTEQTPPQQLRFRVPLRVWVSRAHAAYLPEIAATLGQEASVSLLSEAGLAVGEGPAVVLAAPVDLAAANEAALRAVVQAAEPGRLVLFGGEQDRAVLLTAINHWRVFRLIPSVAGLAAVTDAIRKAHETTETELALEHAIGELAARNHQLGQTLDRLQRTRGQLLHAERLATLGRLTSGLSESLEAHRAATDDLASKTERGALDAELLDVVERTLDGGRSLDALLCDLLSFAENRERPLQLALQDADALAQAALRLAEIDPLARKRNLSVTLEAAGQVNADRYALYQVIINLLRNAMQATSSGGHIALRSRREGAHILFEVEDDGAGMDEATQARLFEPFFTTKGREGLGLGLRVSRMTAERHGGALEFHSSPGEGSTFRLRLPAAGDR